MEYGTHTIFQNSTKLEINFTFPSLLSKSGCIFNTENSWKGGNSFPIDRLGLNRHFCKVS